MTSATRRSRVQQPRRIGLVVGGAAVAAAALAAGATREARASGFLIYDISGQAIGRASAVTADVQEPAAIWFNPAAIAYQDGVNASVGGVFVTAKSSFSPVAGGTETESQRGNFVLPTLFANARVHDRVAVGMGVYTAFGIGIEWPNGWVGREATIKASLQTLAFNPTAAFKINDQLSLAAGFDAVRGVVDFTNGLPAPIGGDVRLAGGAWGFGGNLGVLYRPLPEKLQFGLSYRSRVKLSFDDGRADFSPGSSEFDPALPDQSGTAAITLPDIIAVGAMYKLRPNLALTFDANVVLWSTYSQINISFNGVPGVPPPPAKVLNPDASDTFTLRAGADWAVAAVPGLNLRGGLIFDRSAVRSEGLGPGLPDANRIDFALGVGYRKGWIRGDLGYLLVYFLPADSVGGREGPEGTYRTIANLLGLTIAATWQ